MFIYAIVITNAIVLFPGRDSFLGEQPALALDEFPVALPAITAYRAIGCNDTVTGHQWSERIAPERLPHRLRTATTDAPRKLAISNGFARRDVQQFKVDTPLKRGNGGGEFQLLTYIHSSGLKL